MKWKAVLKALGLAAAAGAVTSVAQAVPDLVRPEIGAPMAAIIAALVGLFMHRPQDTTPGR